LRNWNAYGNRGEAGYTSARKRCRAKIERDHVGGGGIPQKLTMQNADFFLVDKIHFDVDRNGCALLPKLIQYFA
jgi:hypothetical protein